jgi:hypothetical protein
VICSCHARIAYKDNTTYNLKYYMTRKAVSIISALHPTSWRGKQETKIKRVKVNEIPTSSINIVTYSLQSKYINPSIQNTK